MERAPITAYPLPPTSEVSREEKDRFTLPPADTVDRPKMVEDRKIGLNQLINKLNHVNFLDHTVSIVFKHSKYPRSLTLKAYPLPCHDERLTCRWAEKVPVEELIDAYRFDSLFVEKGQQLLEIKPELKSLGEREVVFILPEIGTQISSRKSHRHQAKEITAFMFQNGAFYHGSLIDYSAFQFRIGVETTPPQTFQWVDVEELVTVVFSRAGRTLYSGACRIVKQDHGLPVRHINLEPVKQNIRRFSAREFRNPRQKLTPSPDAVFVHPFFDKRFSLKVLDLSGAGFAVEEEEGLAVLLPGLILPELELAFSDGTILHCMAQVIYSKPHRETPAGQVLRIGLVILDMPVEDHVRMLALLYQANDANSYVCSRVNLDALWDFFFETGFVYPQKYEYIQANKAEIKSTYEKLYHQSPSIATHFIYQNNGQILAHMAIMRFYEKSWLIQHHAAVRKSDNRGGLTVLSQVGRFITDSHRIYSMQMDYVFCYYRPDNKFPSHVFGGAARNIANPRLCSVDNFAYLHHRPKNEPRTALSVPWSLVPAEDGDLENLRIYYEEASGGLMLDALHLSPGRIDCSGVTEAFRKIGLKRGRQLFALRHHQRTCAIIMVNVSDLGLNMSDLTNAITFIVLNNRYMTGDIFHAVIDSLCPLFENPMIPILLYPRSVAGQIGIDYDKTYTLWIYDAHNADPYLRFLKRLLKFI